MIRALTAALLLVGLTGMVWLAGTAFEAAQRRQTTYRYLSEALDGSPEASHRVDWRAPAALDRPFTPAEEQLIGLALDEAWQLLMIAQDTGDPRALGDRWSGVGLDRAALSVRDAAAHGGRMAVLDIVARPVFYHRDGSLLQAETEMTVARFLPAADDAGDVLGAVTLTRDRGLATFMNEAAGWRLFSYELTASDPVSGAATAWSGSLAGVNYYPAETPWRDFWPGFDDEVIAADFATIRDLGGDSVRVFLTRADFLAEDPSAALSDLARLLDLAETEGLQVVPTLFDLRPDYRLAGWRDDALYLDRVLPVLAGSEAVAFVDIKNEPDLDFEAQGAARVTAWLEVMAGLIRAEAPGLPLTVGWSSADHAGRLADSLDVLSYHDYAPIEGTAERLAEVRRLAAGKPVVVTEIGRSSYRLGLGFPGSEERQALDLGERLTALSAADGAMVWTLHDFPEVDPGVIGASPWRRRIQGTFGLYRTDGTAKPAAETLRRIWRDQAPYTDG